jgi:hypothetical protein
MRWFGGRYWHRSARLGLLFVAVAVLLGSCASAKDGPVRQGQAAPARADTMLDAPGSEVRS